MSCNNNTGAWSKLQSPTKRLQLSEDNLNQIVTYLRNELVLTYESENVLSGPSIINLSQLLDGYIIKLQKIRQKKEMQD